VVGRRDQKDGGSLFPKIAKLIHDFPFRSIRKPTGATVFV
jgi:hypothetical protein